MLGLVDEELRVLDEEVHVELVLRLFKLVGTHIQQHLVVIHLALFLVHWVQ